MDEKSLHAIHCKTPGLSCCEHQLISKTPAENVRGVVIWCGRWRENRIKDGVFRHCEPEYHISIECPNSNGCTEEGCYHRGPHNEREQCYGRGEKNSYQKFCKCTEPENACRPVAQGARLKETSGNTEERPVVTGKEVTLFFTGKWCPYCLKPIYTSGPDYKKYCSEGCRHHGEE